MVLQWIVVHPLSKPQILKNAWFFFEVLVRGSVFITSVVQGQPNSLSPSLSLSLSLSPVTDQVYGSAFEQYW